MSFPSCSSVTGVRPIQLGQFYFNLKNPADIQQHRQAWVFAALLDVLECGRSNVELFRRLLLSEFEAFPSLLNPFCNHIQIGLHLAT